MYDCKIHGANGSGEAREPTTPLSASFLAVVQDEENHPVTEVWDENTKQRESRHQIERTEKKVIQILR